MTIRTDDFERAELGANWGEDGVVIASGAAVWKPGNPELGTEAAWIADTFGLTQFSEITMRTKPTGTSYLGTWVRLAAHIDGYLALVWFDSVTTGQEVVNLYTYSAQWQLLQSVIHAYNNGDRLRIAASGTDPVRVRVWLNDGTPLIDYSDAVYKRTGVVPGMSFYHGTGDGAIESWRGGDGDGEGAALITQMRNRKDVIRGRR